MTVFDQASLLCFNQISISISEKQKNSLCIDEIITLNLASIFSAIIMTNVYINTFSFQFIDCLLEAVKLEFLLDSLICCYLLYMFLT